MTADELKAKIAKRLAADPRLRRLRKRIAEGKATALDSFDYSRICSEIMSAELEEAVLELDDREGVCTELLHDRYDDTNAAAAEIQEQLDRKNGLHLRPRKPAFPAERVQKIAHSLVDPGVPDEKIVRRAGSTATVSMSFHEDFVREQADFRSRAGLKCWITRVTDGKCCQWCSDIAGRYEYGEEPEKIYQRHDNCGCSVTFESGRQRQDVWSKRTWEVPGKDAGAAEPTVLTAAQAAEIEAKHQPTVLTNGEKRDIMNIRLDDIKSAVTGSPITEEVATYIFSILAEHSDQFKFDRVRVLSLDPKIVMQTDPVQNGTFYDIVLNLNSAFLGGKTVQQLDAEIEASNVTIANSLREAVIHEIYHGKMYYQKNKGEIDALYEDLEGIKIDGISRTAYKDGFECIAEVGVLYERGETSDIPKDAKDLFFKYLGVKI